MPDGVFLGHLGILEEGEFNIAGKLSQMNFILISIGLVE
jgi:hypothetical protein